MDLTKVIKLECCEIDFKASDKESGLHKLAELMCRSEILKNFSPDEIYKALNDRESKGSTGFGGGIAIPHCQIKGIDEFIIGIAVSKRGVNFEALDKKKVKIFTVIIGPEGDPASHLKLLAQLSRELKEPEVREELINSETKIALYEEFLRHSAVEKKLDLSAKGKDKLMIIVLKDEDFLDDLTGVFVEYGITEAVFIESQQMENLLSRVPLFLGFFNFTGDKNPYNKTILLKINENRIGAVVKGIEDIVGNLDYYSGLSIMVLDLYFSKGNL